MMRRLICALAFACVAAALAQEPAERPAVPPPRPIQLGLGHEAHANWEGTTPKLPDLALSAGNAAVEPDGTLSWKALGKITTIRRENTNKRYGPHVAYFAEPVVSSEVKALVGKKVKVRGYALPRGTADGVTRFLVSGRPAADADGCTSGGAETFVDVRVQTNAAPAVDAMMVVEGTLTLFDAENWDGFIYRLTDVRIVSP